MSKQTNQTLKGFRDFLPAEKRRRDFVAKKVVEVFNRFGFSPLETPTLEYSALLLGKYGTEADKLVYTFTDNGGREVGLRYDQTVPTARVLMQYQNELPKYFRRYQLQNVFRAEKPQLGRYREFMQCDIDIFGSPDEVADAEILACTYESFQNIGFKNIEIRVNDRQTLMAALKPYATELVDVFSIIQSIDKLDKKTPEEVAKELTQKGLTKQAADEAISSIKNTSMSDNLSKIVDFSYSLGIPQKSVRFIPTLARGLDYYTGIIFEVILPEYSSGSVGGGGRYDRLIADLGGPNMPAVGIAFGFDRMIEAATQLQLIPESAGDTQVLVSVFDEAFLKQSLETAKKLRAAGVRTEVYPALDKLAKQFKLADQKNIPFVIIIGEAEVKQNKISLKDMRSGEQTTFTLDELLQKLELGF